MKEKFGTIGLLVLMLWGLIGGYRSGGVAYAQVTVSPPQLVLAQDGCRPSTLPGPPYPDRGDTLTIMTTVTNNSNWNTAFWVVFRVLGTTGGVGGDRTVDLFYGGPSYMYAGGVAVGNWDDSFGMVAGTPILRAGESYPVQANLSLYRRQLTYALNIPDNASVPLTFQVEVFNRDFSRLYGSVTRTQHVTNRRVADCTQLPYDASPVVLLTDRLNYVESDTIYVEWSVIGADKGKKVPSWGDWADGTVEVVVLNDLPTGRPEKDYLAGTVVKTLTVWNTHNTEPCSGYCTAVDESLGVELSYSHLQGDGAQSFTNWVSFPASDLPNNRFFLVRLRPANITAAPDLLKQPQWTYFSVGNPLAVRLASFEASPQVGHVLLTWETVSEVNNLGFDLYRRPAGTETYFRVNEEMIPSRSPGEGEGAVYTYVDDQARPGVLYEYILEDIDANGQRTQHGPVRVQGPYVVTLPLIGK